MLTYRHKRPDSSVVLGAAQVRFQASFPLPADPTRSQFVGHASPVFALPSVPGARCLVRPQGLKPRLNQTALPCDDRPLWLQVHEWDGVAIDLVDPPPDESTVPRAPLRPIRIGADDGAKFEFNPTGSEGLLVVATFKGALISLPVKVLMNAGNVVQRAWERDSHRLMSWRGGIRRVDAWQ